MHILYLFRAVSSMVPMVAQYIVRDAAHTSVFMAEYWPHTVDMTGIKKIRIPPVASYAAPQGIASREQWALEKACVQYVRQAESARALLQRLHKGGLKPDIIHTAPDNGYALHVKEIFPAARVVQRAEMFYTAAFSTERTTAEHVYNGHTLNALQQCDASVTSSAWQKSLFPAAYTANMHVVRNGINTQFFMPDVAKARQDTIIFSCKGISSARGTAQLCAALPMVLATQPHCRIYIVSHAYVRTEEEKTQHGASIAALIPPMDARLRERVHIVASPAQAQYLALLQSATVYVYLAEPSLLTAGILEAMSCGAVVLASATDPVREVITHGENGFLGTFADAHTLADAVTEVMEQAPTLAAMKQNARATITQVYDLQKNIHAYANVLFAF